MATELWQRLRAARKEASRTQQQIADACGISREAVSQWEATDPAKRTFPGLRNLQIVSQETGAPIEWLMSDKGTLSPDYWIDAPTDSTGAELTPDALAQYLTGLATPRSRRALERIIEAAKAGRLSEADLLLLESLAERFMIPAQPGAVSAALHRKAKGYAPSGA